MKVTVELIHFLENTWQQYKDTYPRKATVPGFLYWLRLHEGQSLIYEGSIPASEPEKETTYTDHHAELTPDGWVVRAEKAKI